jgi:hypothetical protein
MNKLVESVEQVALQEGNTFWSRRVGSVDGIRRGSLVRYPKSWQHWQLWIPIWMTRAWIDDGDVEIHCQRVRKTYKIGYTTFSTAQRITLPHLITGSAISATGTTLRNTQHLYVLLSSRRHLSRNFGPSRLALFQQAASASENASKLISFSTQIIAQPGPRPSAMSTISSPSLNDFTCCIPDEPSKTVSNLQDVVITCRKSNR